VRHGAHAGADRKRRAHTFRFHWRLEAIGCGEVDEGARQAECACVPKTLDLSHETYLAYSAQVDAEEVVAPLHASDISAGRSFHLFVGAPVAPMPDDHAAQLIQHKFRNYELQKEKVSMRRNEAAAAIITGKASQYLARKALIGAQTEIEQRKQENAAARIQAHQRMRQERNTLLEIRVQRGRSLAAALYNAKDKDDEKKKHNHVHGHHHHGHSHYGHGANSVFDASASFLRKTGASTRRVGGGHVVVASARDGARKPAMDRKGARHRN